ncbi:MAG: S-layer homology domain-containing protein [Oscillibacter sp.]|nr:S-layer homology domain-containing protein [Oscillibacter sp.]
MAWQRRAKKEIAEGWKWMRQQNPNAAKDAEAWVKENKEDMKEVDRILYRSDERYYGKTSKLHAEDAHSIASDKKYIDTDAHLTQDERDRTVTLNRTDSESDYRLYNFQDYVVYDPNLLSYQGGTVGSDIFTLAAGTDDKGAVYSSNRNFLSLRYQFADTSGTVTEPAMRPASMTVATLKFKVLDDCRTAVYHGSDSETQVWTSATGTNNETVTGKDTTVNAGTPIRYTLTFNAGNGATGTVSPITAYAGELAAIPSGSGLSKTGKTFSGWYDGAKRYYAGDRYYVSKDVSFTAFWDPAAVSYSAGKGGDASGAYTSSGNLFYSGQKMECGTSVTFTAAPSSGYKFTAWSDGSTKNPYTLVVQGDMTLTAEFSPATGGTAANGDNVPVIVDGVEYNIGTAVVDAKQDKTTVVVDQGKLEEQIEKASSTVVVPVAAATDTVSAQLVVKNVEDMAEKSMTLSVKTGGISYDMRAAAVDTGAVMKAVGATDPAAVPVNVTITQLASSAVTLKDGKLMVPPVRFTVTAEYGGKSYEITSFEKYVSRTIEIPSGVDASKITTAVVAENGTERHVPTQVYLSGGKWYARINSLTNSTYALIYNAESFSDTTGKWYRAAVTEMASRKIINGYSNGTFRGEAAVTRAQFAAIIVRALGLPDNGKSSFTDVSSGSWCYGAVGTAVKYGIVQGYSDGSFRPNANITRQQAMAMIARAAAITELGGKTAADLSQFKDHATVGAWAKTYVEYNVANGLIQGDSSGHLNPNDNISRAQTAVVVLRLLQNSKLVDVRAKA